MATRTKATESALVTALREQIDGLTRRAARAEHDFTHAQGTARAAANQLAQVERQRDQYKQRAQPQLTRRVVRVVVIEGVPDWVETTLQRSLVEGQHHLAANGSVSIRTSADTLTSVARQQPVHEQATELFAVDPRQGLRRAPGED
jgi:hypothetical protein